MKRIDKIFIAILALLLAFIWLRDTAWMTSFDDTLPILIAIPLFIWIGAPWNFKESKFSPPLRWFVISVVLLLLGIAFDLTIMLALGWTTLLWGWLSTRVETSASFVKLLTIPVMAFPWITLDFDRLGWWFRLSGATITAGFFDFLGYQVVRDGTFLEVNNIPISVEVACAGLNTLQSMFIAGVIVAYLYLKDTYRFWWNLPLLFILAWVTNTIRIILIVWSAVVISPSFAMGAFHDWGGWLVLVVMFSLCWLIFMLQEPKKQKGLQ